MSESKIVWHKYPQEKPKKDDEYLVSLKMWNKSFTSTSSWITSNDVFEDVLGQMYICLGREARAI